MEITKPKVDHTPAELDEASRILLRAAAILEEHGHCKGRAQHGDSHCLSGAITVASFEFGHWGLYHGHAAAMRRVVRFLDDPIRWNDAPERTKDEVVAKLRAVALAGTV